MAHALSTGSRKPYAGPYRSLVLAIDVGTTFSGVSYAILEPGEIPLIHSVTRFPGQEHVAGNTKIPSVIYYDREGSLVAAGAEADAAAIVPQAEDEGWIKVELFKLRLRPRTMRLNMNGMRFSPLPNKKNAVDVFGDFLGYLYRCTKNFIIDTHANGAALWSAVESHIQFVLSHPNGWEGPQQSKMRRAAIHGELIPDTNAGKARIWFVTEGEASLHACVLNGLAADVLSNPSQHGFLIADAGGGTLDISSYGIKATSPLVIEEIAPPDCIFAGSVFVSRRARKFLEEKLKNSKYGTPDALDHITKKFDESTKRLFRDKKELQFIAFGSPLDKDLSVGIRGGQLKLTGQEVANLFEPSVEAAIDAIKVQIDASKGMIKSVFLVGGYAASPWLFSQLQQRLGKYGVVVSRPDSQTSKAVADGAVGFFCDHHVSARMSKFMYGVEYLREFDQANPDHVAREDRLCELPSGPRLLPDAFDCILARGVQVKESTVFTRKYSTELTSLSLLSVFEVEIWCFRGGNDIPTWIDRQSETFSTLCIVQADLSLLSGSAEPKTSKSGKQYWTIVFSVEIHFGLTEFKARIKWVDAGNTKYGPATIIYNEHGHRAVDDDEPDMYPEDDHSVGGGTPRSERLRSLPASRARSPTETQHPSSPGGNDGSSMYSGDANVIRGVPPPAAMPHPHGLSRERTLSKPTTPKAMSPAIPQLEREPSRQSRRDRGTSSRASSIAGAKIGETLSSVWGGVDPQLRSPIPPQSPQTPTQQPPPPQPPTPQPPSQPRSQQQTPKPKSRKSSMSALSHATSQPSPPPPPPQQPELAAPPQSSPRPPSTSSQGQAASSRPGSAQASPRSAHASPKSSILPPSRGLSRVGTPQKQENPLSPLNPSAQAHPELGAEDAPPAPASPSRGLSRVGTPQKHESPRTPLNPSVQAQPELGVEDTAPAPVSTSRGLSMVGTPQRQENPLSPLNPSVQFGADDAARAPVIDTWARNEEMTTGAVNDIDFGAQDAGWGFGESNENWELGGEDSAGLDPIPGAFEGGVEGAEGAEDLLGGGPAPLIDPVGGSTLLSGSISSLMSSNPVSGLSHKLSNLSFGFGSGGAKNTDSSLGSGFGTSFGLGGKKPDEIELKSGLAWGSSAAKAAAGKAGAAFGAWGAPSAKAAAEKAGAAFGVWGAPAKAAAEKAGATLGAWSAPSARDRNSQSAASSNVVTPNPPGTPHIPEQAAQSPPATENAVEEPGIELVQVHTAEGEPAEGQEATGEYAQDPAAEEKGAEQAGEEENTAEGEAHAAEEANPASAGLSESNTAPGDTGPQNTLAEDNPEETPTHPAPSNPLTTETNAQPDEQIGDPQVTAPPSLDDEGFEMGLGQKKKKGKKNKQAPTEPSSPTTPTVENAWSTSSKKGKKDQKGWAETAWGIVNAGSQENENGEDVAEQAGEQTGDLESVEKLQENAKPKAVAENTEGQDESGPADKPDEEGQGDEGDNNEADEGEDETKPNAGSGKKKKAKGGGSKAAKKKKK